MIKRYNPIEYDAGTKMENDIKGKWVKYQNIKSWHVSNADCKKYWKSYFRMDLKKKAEKRMKGVSDDWAMRDGFDRGFKAGIMCMLEIMEDEFK
ncbi:MAG: hypothetical protein Q8O88_00815 [bacterium]|nr:hypothetical protein [bacterium]